MAIALKWQGGLPAKLATVLMLSAPLADAVDKRAFHVDAQRSGWNREEFVLTPGRVANGGFGLLWQTPMLDTAKGVPPRLFASPLYLERAQINVGVHRGKSVPTVFVLSSTGFAYAIVARKFGGIQAGEILWRRRLTDAPCEEGTMGNLSTPVIDSTDGHLYVTSCQESGHWSVHSLNVGDGSEASGWPVALNSAAINPPGINRNGATQFLDADRHIQRGALNLAKNDRHLYIPFGFDTSSGWLIVVDTQARKVVSAFSTTAQTEQIQGGMWASGGPSIDAQDRVYVSTGASSAQMFKHAGIPGVFPDREHSWGQSILQFADKSDTGLELLGSYTPFNYCLAAANDIDLGSSGTLVFDADGTNEGTQHFVALAGGKQGNAYLLDREHMPGGVQKRSPCSEKASEDRSLTPPDVQPQFGSRGPLNIFGPFSNTSGSFDQAKSRTTASLFQPSGKLTYLYATGSAKRTETSSASVPPGLVKLQLGQDSGGAYWKVDRREMTQTFQNPGSPVVSSNRSAGAIVWVLDTNAPRTATLYGAHALHPVLYAFDGQSLELLWKSEAEMLPTGGKYNEPTVANGAVYVGTDRLQAFGLNARNTLRHRSNHLRWQGNLQPWEVSAKGLSLRRGFQSGASFIESVHEYDDFELHFRYRIEDARDRLVLGFRSEQAGAGYSTLLADPNSGQTYSIYRTGPSPALLVSLADNAVLDREDAELKRQVKNLVNTPDAIKAAVRAYPAWNEYVLSVSGNQMSQAINGVLINEAMDADVGGRLLKGHINLDVLPGLHGHLEIADVGLKAATWPYLWSKTFSTHPQAALASLSEEQQKHINAGRAIFEQRCRVCHGNPDTGAPSPDTLAQFPSALITDALTNGPMRAMASGLDDDAKVAVATYLTTGWVESSDER